jgi:hypothetical protein
MRVRARRPKLAAMHDAAFDWLTGVLLERDG